MYKRQHKQTSQTARVHTSINNNNTNISYNSTNNSTTTAAATTQT